MALSVNRAQFKRHWQFYSAVHDRLRAKAEQHTAGKWDWSRWEGILPPIEFDTLLLINFLASWENNGRFIDTVQWYEDMFPQIGRAFRRFGFNVAAALMPRALELDAIQTQCAASDIPLPTEIEAEIKQTDAAATADVSEERLTAAITLHADAFSV